MTIKLVGNFDTAELCNTLAAHFGSQAGWCLSGSDREVEFIQQNPSLDISGVQAIFDAHGAINHKLAAAISKVKASRKVALDLFVKNSPGISRIYGENYFAATEFQAGRTTSLMVCGVTVAEYLLNLGQNLGMTAVQFAAYIINENRGTVGLAIKASEIETEYVRLVYSAMPTMTEAQALQATIDYATFCLARKP